MRAGFEYGENSFEIVNFVRFKNQDLHDNPFDCTFDIKVVSRRFAGYAVQYELAYPALQQFISQLDDLYHFKTQKVKMPDVDLQNSRVEFQMDQCGHLTISGTLWDFGTFQSLDFSFEADQTILPPFIRELKCL